MTVHRQHLGVAGEELAAAALTDRGYTIVARRYETERGEIDIIAEEGGYLVFVEVRSRATAEMGLAAESVTEAKRRQVSRMAAEYLAVHRIADRPCRFDVVAIDDALGSEPRVTVFANAFDASGRS